MFCVTLFVFWLLRQVYHTTSRKNTPIRKNFPFFLRTCVPAMYARTQRLTRNAQYRGMQSKRQDTTATVIPCLYLLLFPVLRTLAVGLPANKKRTRTLSLRETDSGTSCVAEHSQRHLNLQIACSTAMQSASAFRKESFPQSRSSCSRTFARESAV